MARNDPLRTFRYRLEVDNVTQAGFSEVAIAGTPIEAIDHRQRTDPPRVGKVSGLTKYGNVTLKGGAGANALDLYKWYSDVSSGQTRGIRKRVVIVVQDEAGKDRARFVVRDAWPVKYDPSDLNAKGNEVTIELLELGNEGIECVK